MTTKQKTISLTFNYKAQLNIENEEYWKIVGEFLSVEVQEKFTLEEFKKKAEERLIIYRSEAGLIEIIHRWSRDGSSNKPETFITFEISGIENSFRIGRLGIWSKGINGQSGPHAYADDITGIIANNM